MKKALKALASLVLLPDHPILWLPHALKAGGQIAQSRGIDAILATSPPFSTSIIGVLLKKRLRKPLIVDFRDDWLSAYVHKRRPRVNRWLHPKMESWVVHQADGIILVTEASLNDFRSRYPEIPREKFQFVSNGYDPQDYQFLLQEENAVSASKFTVTYNGTLSDDRDPTPLLEALKQIKETYSLSKHNVMVRFHGDISPTLQTKLPAFGLTDIVDVDTTDLPLKEVIHSMVSSHVLLAYSDKNANTQIPGKLYEYWAVGKPVLLLAERGAASDLVQKYSLGIVVPPDSVEEIKQALSQLYETYKSGNLLKPSQAALEDFDRRRLTQKLVTLLNKVTDNAKPGAVNG